MLWSLPNHGGSVAVLPQDPADRGAVAPNQAVVARKAARRLGDDAEADRMMVPARDQRSAGRRAERRGVEIRIAQAIVGDAVERRRRNDAAEGRGRGEANVVGHDEQDIRRAFRRHDARGPIGLRLRRVEFDFAPEPLRRRREDMAVDRDCRIRRARRAVNLLRARRAKGLERRCAQSHQERRQTSAKPIHYKPHDRHSSSSTNASASARRGRSNSHKVSKRPRHPNSRRFAW